MYILSNYNILLIFFFLKVVRTVHHPETLKSKGSLNKNWHKYVKIFKTKRKILILFLFKSIIWRTTSFYTPPETWRKECEAMYIYRLKPHNLDI